jgi:hypothetical protein
VVGELFRNADAAVRLGAFDPFLNTARLAGAARWGAGVAAMLVASAMRFPSRIAISDEAGEIDYRTLDCQA